MWQRALSGSGGGGGNTPQSISVIVPANTNIDTGIKASDIAWLYAIIDSNNSAYTASIFENGNMVSSSHNENWLQMSVNASGNVQFYTQYVAGTYKVYYGA